MFDDVVDALREKLPPELWIHDWTFNVGRPPNQVHSVRWCMGIWPCSCSSLFFRCTHIVAAAVTLKTIGASPPRPARCSGARAGLRHGEQLGLQVGDIDLRRKELRVARSVTAEAGGRQAGPTKNERSRIVPIRDRLPVVLRPLVEAATAPGAWILLSTTVPGAARAAVDRLAALRAAVEPADTAVTQAPASRARRRQVR